MMEVDEKDGWGLDPDSQGYLILTAAAAGLTGEVLSCVYKIWVYPGNVITWELRRPALHIFTERKDFQDIVWLAVGIM